MEPKILLVSAYNAKFVRNDIEILKRNFQLDTAIFSDSKRTVFYIYKTIRILMRKVKQNDVCIIWFADFRAFITVLLAKLFRKKTIVIVGGYEVANVPEMKYGSIYNKRTFFPAYALKFCDTILSYSDFSTKEINDFIKNREVKRIYLYPDFADIKNFIKKENTVVLIGNAVEEFYPVYKLKGIDTFAKTAALLPDVNFSVIGKYDKKIIEPWKRTNLNFLGFVENSKLRKILSETKVYCQLSYRESFGLALAEAMQCECVPVVCNRGSLPEVVGDTGFYVPFGDAKETAKAIQKEIKIDKGKKARKRIENNFKF